MLDSGSDDVVPVFFLSDSTGISAETMGNALLIQFPDVRFERTLIPFISSIEEARDGGGATRRCAGLELAHSSRVRDGGERGRPPRAGQDALLR